MVKTRAAKRQVESLIVDDDDLEVDSDESCEESDSDDSVMKVRFDNSEDDIDDDDLFMRYTDCGVEDHEGIMGGDDEFAYLGPDDAAVFSDVEYASDSLDSFDDASNEEGMDGEKKDAHPVFREIKHMDTYKWHPGIRFPTRDMFKDAVATYAIQGGWSLKWIKFDNIRARVGCVDGCKFLLFCSKVRGADTWELKTVFSKHSCERKSDNKLLNSKWLANRLASKMRRNPKMKLTEIMQKVREKYTIEISKTVASRARKKALEVVHGSYKEQYKRLHDFCAEILRSNPGSSCGLIVDRPPEFAIVDDPTPARTMLPKFDKLYMCLDGCKKAFISACRPIVGLDGCFLKGLYGGQLLAAVGKDPNDGILPIAIAVVRNENRESWDWFVTRLLEDIGAKGRLTFMSDRQKGLVNVLDALQGQHDHRFCVRHLYNNIRKRFPGLQMKELLWRAASATYIEAWEREMKEIQRLNPGAYAELSALDGRLWSKSHFSGYCKCDTLLNNMSETFNSNILQYREKPIATMLDEIRGYFMTKWAENRIKINRYVGTILPRIAKKLDKEHKEAGKWLPRWAGEMKFEVVYMQDKFVVDLSEYYCSCRKWELTGIPCRHAMSCIYSWRMKVEEFVPHCFKGEAYDECYSHIIYPTEGQGRWPRTNHDDIEPPIVEKLKGRPKKQRRKEQDEPSRGKASKSGVKMRCSKCGQENHNARTCKGIGVAGSESGTSTSTASSVRPPPVAVRPSVRPSCQSRGLGVLGRMKNSINRPFGPGSFFSPSGVLPRPSGPRASGPTLTGPWAIGPRPPLVRAATAPKFPVFRPKTTTVKYYGPSTYTTIQDPHTGAIATVQEPSHISTLNSGPTQQTIAGSYGRGLTGGSSSSSNAANTQESVNK